LISKGIKDYTSPSIKSPVISGHSTKVIGCRFVSLFKSKMFGAWYKDGNVIKENVTLTTSSNDTHYINTLESLVIGSTSQSDAGEYKCVISITYSSGNRSFLSNPIFLSVKCKLENARFQGK